MHYLAAVAATFWVCVITAFTDADNNYEPHCAEGYKYEMKEGCQDVNECLQLPCKTGQVCHNLMGSFECLCPRGYKIDDSTGDCEDVNECDQGYCGKDACINTNGSYTCVCPSGMKKIGRFCRDVNECIQQPCSEDEYCINTRGSYRCMCRMGFEKTMDENGTSTCVDTDECGSLPMCQAYGERCVNTPGSYKCMCQDGYTHDATGRYCQDLNECDLDSCPSHSECINTYGSFYCRCHRGFTMSEDGMCEDTRDCMFDEGSKCQWKCIDTPGAFQCMCPNGYDQSDFSCVDVNECDRADSSSSEMGGPCNKSEMCINTRGGYQCIDKASCPSDVFYRKLTRTDEFGRRAFTTNTCRRRCRHLREKDDDAAMYRECKMQPMSVAFHYIDIASRLATPRRIFRIRQKTRRRRQKYAFEIVKGDTSIFGLKQVSKSVPTAFLMLKSEQTGPAQHQVKVDMTTYNKRGKKRDNRMVTLTIFVGEYEF